MLSNVRIQRIELDEYRNVKAIEFYIDSNPLQVIEFLRIYGIGKQFAGIDGMPIEPPTKYIVDDRETADLTTAP